MSAKPLSLLWAGLRCHGARDTRKAKLAGVYPNSCGEGIGRGHLFALRQLLARDGV